MSKKKNTTKKLKTEETVVAPVETEQETLEPVEMSVILETDEQLQVLLADENSIQVPDHRLWVKTTKKKYNGRCPKDIGDGRVSMANQYYGVEAEDGSMYVCVGRSDVVDEKGRHTKPSKKTKPTGHYKKLDKESQKKWVKEFGVENFTLRKPKEKKRKK